MDGSLSDSHPYKNEATLNDLSTKKRLSLLNRPEFMSAGFDMDNESGKDRFNYLPVFSMPRKVVHTVGKSKKFQMKLHYGLISTKTVFLKSMIDC